MGTVPGRSLWGWVAAALLLSGALAALATNTQAPQAPSAEKKDSPKAVYVGAEKCAPCHRQAAARHLAGPHRSLQSLPVEGGQGCEACHGPGSLHVAGDRAAIVNPAKLKGPEAEAFCLKCHRREGGSPGVPLALRISERTWMRGKHPRRDVACTACHSEHKPEGHLLKAAGSGTCVTCHADMKPRAGEFGHTAIQSGNCLQCHDPHNSNKPSLLRSTVDRTCGTCHDVAATGFGKSHAGFEMKGTRCTSCHSAHLKEKGAKGLPANQHRPFLDRKCNLCHMPSTASKTAALIKPVNELCARCHPAVARASTGAHAHPPVKQGLCTVCHNPHDSRQSRVPLLRARAEYVCLQCHASVDTARTKKHQHAPVDSGNCLSCHFGHKSEEPHLLVKPDIELCKGCHPQEHRSTHPVGYRDDGKTRKMVVDPRTGKMLVCSSCHQVHGGDHDYITAADWRRELCVLCHGKYK